MVARRRELLIPLRPPAAQLVFDAKEIQDTRGDEVHVVLERFRSIVEGGNGRKNDSSCAGRAKEVLEVDDAIGLPPRLLGRF